MDNSLRYKTIVKPISKDARALFDDLIQCQDYKRLFEWHQ